MRILSESELMFSGSDAKPPAKWAMPVLKVKDCEIMCGIICSPDITAHFHHYWGGRSYLCLPHGCRACEAGNPQKQMGFFPILLEKNGGRGFVEIPYGTIQFFDRELQRRGSLERVIVRMFRHGGQTNQPLRATFHGLCDEAIKLPGFPPTRKWLLNMWGVEVGPLGVSDQTGSNSHPSEKTKPIIFGENAG